MLLQSRRGLLCCGCGGSAVVAGGRAAAAARFGGDEGHQPAGGHNNKQSGAGQVSWAQVESMTCGFTSGVVGEGGFSTVYLGRVGGGSGTLAAVKVHRSGSGSERAFRQELEALLRLRHPHIVRLLAFSCCDDQDQQGQGVLVLELAPNGNLHDHLHANHQTMEWPRRVSVALQVARALEYLHHRCEPQVVHGDVKASNVLLDAAMAARLCDFGSARAGFLSAARRRRHVLGSPGYVDPHYLRSGVLTTKTDVYSFGVLLLEMLTGVQPCFQFQHARLLTAMTTAADLVDQRLGCRYDAAEAAAMLALAAACIGDNPTLRPSMAHVVQTLESSAQASISAVGTTSDGSRKQ